MKIFSRLSENRKFIIPVIGLISIFFLFPRLASAQMVCPPPSPFWWDWMLCAIEGVEDSWVGELGAIIAELGRIMITIAATEILIAVSLILGGIAMATGTMVGVANGFLMAIVEIVTDGVPIINADIVQNVGWPIARDFVNMLFILILAFIGLATVLRLETYQYKKTLPSLLIIALLVNFSLVFVGFIVDMGNIVTNFFLNEFASIGAGGVLQVWDLVGTYYTDIVEEIMRTIEARPIQQDPGQFPINIWVGYAAYGIALILYFIFAFFILLFAAFILFFRIIALWILAILAPFAFAAYILPSTRQYWDGWLKQLIQWAFIGAILGFFLYLGSMIMSVGVGTEIPITPDNFDPLGPPGVDFSYDGDPTYVDFMGVFLERIISPFVGLIFFAIGIFAALQFAPAGARQVISYGKKYGPKAAGVAGGVIRGVPQVSKTEEQVRKRLERVPGLGRVMGGIGAYDLERRKIMEEESKKYASLPKDQIREIMSSRPGTYKDRLKQAGLFKILIERRELMTKEELEENKLSGDDKMMMNRAITMGAVKESDIYMRRPDWAPNIGEQITKTEPEDLRKYIQKEAVQKPEVVLEILKDESKFREIATKARGDVKQQMKKTFQDPYFAERHAETQYRELLERRAYQFATDPHWGGSHEEAGEPPAGGAGIS